VRIFIKKTAYGGESQKGLGKERGKSVTQSGGDPSFPEEGGQTGWKRKGVRESRG